ncbi:MAG: prolyl oligopeptidase family serine peptidase [Firmicutes bacterium]|nr:prolyl oligopeptidase family serine peptidase [Bacillota bacterium]
MRTSLRGGGMRRLSGALLLGIVLSVMFVPSPGLASSRYTTPANPMEVIKFYSYDRNQPLDAKLVLRAENEWYRRYELTYKSEGDTVYAAYFEPRRPGKAPAAIGIHGMFSEDEDQFWHVADFAAKRGFAVLMPSLPFHHRRSKGIQVISGQKFVVAPPVAVRDNFRRAVIDMRRGVDWLMSRDNVDSERIYITGASLGGMVSMLTYKADPRLKGGVFLVAGAGFREILVNSENPVVRNFRLLSKIGLTDIIEAADTLMLVDPAALPDIWPRPVLMLNGTLDVIFPISETLRAASSFDDVDVVWAKSSHFYPVSGGQYLIADFVSRLSGMPLELRLSQGATVRETVLPPVPGDSRLWISLSSSNGAHQIRGAHTNGFFGIHLVNRLTPTLIVPDEIWEMHRQELESVPASIFVVNSIASGDLAFALSYIRLLERSHGGAYVLLAPDWKGSQVTAHSDGGKVPAYVTWLSPLDMEIAWSVSIQMDESGLRNADVLSGLGLKREKVDDVTGYLRGRIKVSDIPPIPSLIYDTATDIRWAEPPM